MRENRLSGSEGGATELNRLSRPLSNCPLSRSSPHAPHEAPSDRWSLIEVVLMLRMRHGATAGRSSKYPLLRMRHRATAGRSSK